MKVRILEDVDRKMWDERVEKVAHGTIFQSPIMAGLMQEIRGITPLYLVVEDSKGELCAQL